MNLQIEAPSISEYLAQVLNYITINLIFNKNKLIPYS